jgi:hypothetical protein
VDRPDWLELAVLAIGLVLGLVLIVRAEQLAARAAKPTPATANRLAGAGALCIGLGAGVQWLDPRSPAAWDGGLAVLAAVLLVAMLAFLVAAVVVLLRARSGAR